MEDFQNFLEELDLTDHPYSSPLFIWSNKQDDNYSSRKLDRVMVNTHWLNEFPDSYVEFHAQGVSDHYPAVKKKKNTIWMLTDEDGNRPKDFESMSKEMVCFFTQLIGSPNPNIANYSVDQIKEFMHYSLPEDVFSDLSKEVSDREIKEALFRQAKDKSPRPEGYIS
ncbi:hypothetical protein V6N13_123827 [Hibiscus sabdariffa]